MKLNKYYGAAVAAFVIWGFFSLALRPLHNYLSLDILFYRVFFCAVIMLCITLLLRKKVRKESYAKFMSFPAAEKKRVVLLTCSGGLLLAGNWFFFIYVMNHISIKAAAFAYLVCPILTTVLAYVILKEKLSKLQWAAVAISALSCILLGANQLADLMYSLIVAFSYALYLITQKKNPDIDRFFILTIQLVFAALLLLPFYPVYSGPVPAEPVFYALVLLIVVLFTIIPLFLNLYALQGVNSSAMGILLYVNPLLNFVIAIFYFNEKSTASQLIAYGLILLSILIFNSKHLVHIKQHVKH